MDVPPAWSNQTQALVALYNATGGSQWLNNRGWSSFYAVGSSDPCRDVWPGVTCRNTSTEYSYITYVVCVPVCVSV